MQYQLQSEYHLLEAQWTNDNYQPGFKEHEELSSLSSTLPMLILAGLMGYDAAIATKELFEWTSAVPDVIRAGSKIDQGPMRSMMETTMIIYVGYSMLCTLVLCLFLLMRPFQF